MARRIAAAEILAIGSELTSGATRDTNSGDLARELTALGVLVLRTTALPDELATVTRAFEDALSRADVVVSTGGMGPTPDDLTREAIAAACGLEPHVDAQAVAWLEGLFARRGMDMPEANRKQAWLIDGADALSNSQGTAPGWWVERPDGRLIIALPGPPREWRAMWREHALPRLQAGSLGVERASYTLRLTGIGESSLVELIGEDVLRAPNPQVATYSRAEAVDVVVSAAAEGGKTARELVDSTTQSLRGRIGRYVFADGDSTWADALAVRLDGRTLAIVERGTAGQLAALLGAAEFLVHAELVREPAPLPRLAEAARRQHAADLGLAVSAIQRDADTRVRVALASARGSSEVSRTVFLAGDEGRRRAALAACAVLWERLVEASA